MSDLVLVFSEIVRDQTLIVAVFSSPKGEGVAQKVTCRPVEIQGKFVYQLTEQKGSQAFHSNVESTEIVELLVRYCSGYKHAVVYTLTADYHILTSKKEKTTVLKKPPTKKEQLALHNRQKQYLLEEGVPVPFLVELGVMNREGRVYPKKMDKFRQINRFLEMVDDILEHLDAGKKLHVVDFGCGKAYLTFALFHYLKVAKGFDILMTGVDLKSEVIAECQSLATELGYGEALHFVKGEIGQFTASEPEIDLVVALHACDVATDAAIAKALGWKAKVILCAPCCQHELFNQVKNEALKPLLKHGILKERFAALATDAARAQLLEAMGYRTQVLEFIDAEHTPKNLMIRAVRVGESERNQEVWSEYVRFKEALSIVPALETLIEKSGERKGV